MASTMGQLRVWNIVVGVLLLATLIVIVVLWGTANMWCQKCSVHAQLLTCPTGGVPMCPPGYRLQGSASGQAVCVSAASKAGSGSVAPVAPACPRCPFGDLPQCPKGFVLQAGMDGTAACVSTTGSQVVVPYQCNAPAPNPTPGSGPGPAPGPPTPAPNPTADCSGAMPLCPVGYHLQQTATGLTCRDDNGTQPDQRIMCPIPGWASGSA